MTTIGNPYDVSLSTLTLNSAAVDIQTEEIVIDERDTCTPTDFVQQKLQRLLPSSTIPVSCLHTGRIVRRYTS